MSLAAAAACEFPTCDSDGLDEVHDRNQRSFARPRAE